VSDVPFKLKACSNHFEKMFTCAIHLKTDKGMWCERLRMRAVIFMLGWEA
jgi:hypothetical protein